jgi:hypothetical protein
MRVPILAFDISCAQWHKTRNSRETTKNVGCLQSLRCAAPRSSPLPINYQIRVIACGIRHTCDWWMRSGPYGSSTTKKGLHSGRSVKRCETKGNSDQDTISSRCDGFKLTNYRFFARAWDKCRTKELECKFPMNQSANPLTTPHGAPYKSSAKVV